MSFGRNSVTQCDPDTWCGIPFSLAHVSLSHHWPASLPPRFPSPTPYVAQAPFPALSQSPRQKLVYNKSPPKLYSRETPLGYHPVSGSTSSSQLQRGWVGFPCLALSPCGKGYSGHHKWWGSLLDPDGRSAPSGPPGEMPGWHKLIVCGERRFSM